MLSETRLSAQRAQQCARPSSRGPLQREWHGEGHRQLHGIHLASLNISELRLALVLRWMVCTMFFKKMRMFHM